MPAHCWKCLPDRNCCPYSGCTWTSYRCSIDNVRDNPPLPLPDYINKGGGTGDNMWWYCPNYSGEPYATTQYWSQYCNPATTEFQISPGPYIIDVPSSNARAPSQTGGIFLDKGNVLACRFIPSGICIPYIVFHNAYYRASTPNIRTIVEVREQDSTTLFPKGTFGDDNMLARVSVLFPPDLHSFAVPINAILNQVDVPYWIVIYSEDLLCATGNTGAGFRRVEFSPSNIGGSNLATYSQSGATCIWSMNTSFPSISLVTYRSDTCRGVAIIDDFGFAIDNTFIIDNCFKTLAESKNKNVIVGVRYRAPRTYRRVRFTVSYIRPDRTIFGYLTDVMNTAYGNNEVFLDSGEFYRPGIDLEYTSLAVSAEVIQV